MFLLLVCRPDRLVVIAWWQLTGKRLRASYKLESAIAALPFATERWMMDVGKDDLGVVARARRSRTLPTFCVHLHVDSGADLASVRRAIASVKRQSEKPCHFFITSSDGDARHPGLSGNTSALSQPCPTPMSGLHAALAAARDQKIDYLVPLPFNGWLPRHAIAGYSAFVSQAHSPELPLMFGDQRNGTRAIRSSSYWFKSEWDPRMFLSQDYVSDACAIPVVSALNSLRFEDHAPAFTGIYELILHLSRSVSAAVRVQHLDRVTMVTVSEAWRNGVDQRLLAVQRYVSADTKVFAGPFGTVQLHWAMPQPHPKVSVIIPTRDQSELLRTCVDGVLWGTDYSNIELIIADNDSCDLDALAYIEQVGCDPRVRVVRWPHPFNYSAINNHAARFASGEYLCLLNNDIEVIEPRWLTELVREAVQPNVGAVGARLLYSDRSLQHAGVAIGIGNAAGHVHRGLPLGDPGYFAHALIARGTSAVTGACLLVSKRHFDAVGGLDEAGLAVAYNDVDLCLKLVGHGLSNIYTPASTLIHHESKSRGLDFAPDHLERYMNELSILQARWGTEVAVDPWHHQKLDRSSEVYHW